MPNLARRVVRLILLVLMTGGAAPTSPVDSYELLLQSRSLSEQRAALTAIMSSPQTYVPEIRQSLRDYPRLLRSNATVANRVVYLSALLRDPSFPPILVKSLAAPEVQDDCEYACPSIFALAVDTYFGHWQLPATLDPRLQTVYDLKAEIRNMSRINLNIQPIESVVQGPELEKYRSRIEGKPEEQLIQMAGPMTLSEEDRMFAAFRLETIVSSSKNRIDLYLLALNDFEDASGEYRSAVYQSIDRAELAKSRGK